MKISIVFLWLGLITIFASVDYWAFQKNNILGIVVSGILLMTIGAIVHIIHQK